MKNKHLDYVKENYWFCYSPRMKEELEKRGFYYIATALNSNSLHKFYLYERSDEFNQTLDSLSTVQV